MQPLRVPIRVVIYQVEGSWVAHCLEFDLLGDGETQEEALERLAQAIRIQVEATRDFGNPANLFSPAEGKYFRMFAAGRDVAAQAGPRFQVEHPTEIRPTRRERLKKATAHLAPREHTRGRAPVVTTAASRRLHRVPPPRGPRCVHRGLNERGGG